MRRELLKNEMRLRTLKIESNSFDDFLLKISNEFEEKVKKYKEESSKISEVKLVG